MCHAPFSAVHSIYERNLHLKLSKYQRFSGHEHGDWLSYCNTSTSTSPLTPRQDPFSFLARAVTVPERGVYGTGRGALTLVKRDSNPPPHPRHGAPSYCSRDVDVEVLQYKSRSYDRIYGIAGYGIGTTLAGTHGTKGVSKKCRNYMVCYLVPHSTRRGLAAVAVYSRFEKFPADLQPPADYSRFG